jgi:lysophospholipase L1-like esterase
VTAVRALAAAAAVITLLAGCGAGSPPPGGRSGPAAPTPTPRPSAASIVYAALGASETAGVGTHDPTREAFPQQLYQRLGPAAVMYSFGIPGERTDAALRDELPQALAVHPTLATVWFNVDDMIGGVAVADFESRLDQIVGGLRQGGVTKVLVANTPHLDRLPAYFACRPDAPPGARCLLGAVRLPPAEVLDAEVQAYNAVIARVVQRQGATLVDLYAAGEVPDQHPEYVSDDGFHPSAQGAAAIAATFAAALGS